MTLRNCEYCHGPGPCLWNSPTSQYRCRACHSEPGDAFFTGETGGGAVTPCTCDAVGTDPCPRHGREMHQQDERIRLQNIKRGLAANYLEVSRGDIQWLVDQVELLPRLTDERDKYHRQAQDLEKLLGQIEREAAVYEGIPEIDNLRRMAGWTFKRYEGEQ